MTKIAEFIYWLNRTRPRTDKATFQAVWKHGVIKARLEVDYKTEIKLDILPEEIENGDPETRAIEVAEQMEKQYKERMSMPLLEGKL